MLLCMGITVICWLVIIDIDVEVKALGACIMCESISGRGSKFIVEVNKFIVEVVEFSIEVIPFLCKARVGCHSAGVFFWVQVSVIIIDRGSTTVAIGRFGESWWGMHIEISNCQNCCCGCTKHQILVLSIPPWLRETERGSLLVWGAGGSVVCHQSCHGHHDFRQLSYGCPT